MLTPILIGALTLGGTGDSVKVTHNAYCVQWCSTRSRSPFSSSW
jgi:hypothetical protein